MVPEIVTAIATVKSMSDITSLLIKAKVDTATTEKAIELQSSIISLQTTLLAIQAQNQDLLSAKNELEQRLIEIESWNAQAESYKLEEITSGIFVMASQPNENDCTPAHWLCANCYQKKQKAILQYNGNPSDGVHYFCPNCKNEVADHTKSWSPFAVA